MNDTTFAKAGILMLILEGLSLVSWEFYVRRNGYDLSYDDAGPLWTHKRKQVYESPGKFTIFIGSSRIKFDLDIETWESITGDHAIQLACVGSTPLPILKNLADDKKFAGKLVIDVTEGLFFSGSPNNADRPLTNLKYYKDETPAQKAGFQLNHLLESQLAFLDKDRLSLNAMLSETHI